MSTIPEDLKYIDTHEWIRIDGKRAVVGITDYAQESLGDIVYVEVPEVDEEFEKGEEVATVESVKAASPINIPLSGRIVEINEDLDSKPELINQKPYQVFIFALEMSRPDEVDTLLDASAYQRVVEQEEGA
jgi:glycine cleavage system H protein